MAIAKSAFGTIFAMGPAGGTLVEVAKVRVVDPPKLSRDMEDTTTHDSAEGAVEKSPVGVVELSNMKNEGYLLTGDADDLAFEQALLTGELQDVSWTSKGAAGVVTKYGSAYVSNYGAGSFEVKGMQTFEAELTMTGPLRDAA